MNSSTVYKSDFRLLLPEVLWLEPEHFEWSRRISDAVISEEQQWQAYLNGLALKACEQWLRECLPHQIVKVETAGYLEVEGIKLCLIVTEHLIDEVVQIPQSILEAVDFTIHFYLVVEVSEEEEAVTIRGILPHDLLANLYTKQTLVAKNGFYQLPLDWVDPEPNHLLFYCHSQIPSQKNSESKDYINLVRTKLSQWLQNVVDESWQAIEELLSPNAALWSTRNPVEGEKRGKLIDLGIQMGSAAIALLVGITQENNEKLSVLVQLHPTGGDRYLPSNLNLALLSETGDLLHEVTSRSHDNYIQLRRFKGKLGKYFTIEVSLGDHRIREKFEL